MTTHRPRSLFLAAALASSLGIGRCVERLPQTPRGKAMLEVHSLAGALSLFRFDIGRYPSTAEGLQALILDPGVANWAGPYLSEELREDPWGRAYQYRAIGNDAFQIWSLGQTGKREVPAKLQIFAKKTSDCLWVPSTFGAPGHA